MCSSAREQAAIGPMARLADKLIDDRRNLENRAIVLRSDTRAEFCQLLGLKHRSNTLPYISEEA